MGRLVILSITLGVGCMSVADRGVTDTSRIVRSVEIVGNHAIDDEPIVEGLATRPPRGLVFRTYEPFDPLSLQVDIDRITHYYQTQGYFSARVTDTRVREEPEKPEEGYRLVEVRFFVDEGQPARITHVRLEGVPAALRPRIDLQRIAGAIRKGNVFHDEAYQTAKRRLRRWLLERGYAHAEVEGTVAVDRDSNTVVVTFAVRPGPRARFGTTSVEGLDEVPRSAVENRLGWAQGEVFDPDAIELTRGRLYELGLFSFVRIDYQRAGASEVVDMTIRVTEISPHDVRLGGGLAIDPGAWELRARASYTQRSFLDPLLILRLDARPGYAFRHAGAGRKGLGGEARLTLERGDFLYPRLALRGAMSYDQTEIDIYRSIGPSGRVELYRAFLGNRLLLSAGWDITYLRLSDVPPVVAARADALGLPGDDDAYRNAFFNQSLAYDRRDSLIDPTEGIYAELRIEEGGGFAGGTYSSVPGYIRGTGDVRGYVPVGTRRLVLAGRVRYGRAIHGALPVTRRYFAGGASSHRGFAQRHLSPTVIEEQTGPEEEAQLYRIGGAELLESSVELRWDVTRVWDNWLGLATFVDAGGVALETGSLDLGDLQWAVGAGLRYYTPVGPLRLDVGYRLTDLGPALGADSGPGLGQMTPAVDGRASIMDRLVFHLTLGEAF